MFGTCKLKNKKGGNMSNVLEAISKVAALKNTFIEELFEAMQNEWFDCPDNPIESDEQVFATMNELEKSLFFLMKKYHATETKIIRVFCKEGRWVNYQNYPGLVARLETCRSRFQIAEKLMWESIETRLADEKTKAPMATAWGLRAGNQIVQMFNNDEGGKHNLYGQSAHADLLGIFMRA